MERFAWGLFIAVAAAAAAIIVGTESGLPARVATHFGSGGRANGYMMRDDYTFLMLALAVGLPLLVVACTAWLPRIAPRMLKLDRCKRWDDPKRQREVFASTAIFGAIAATLVAGFIGGMHLLIVAANESKPPQLDESKFLPFLATFIAAILVASILHAVRMRRAQG